MLLQGSCHCGAVSFSVAHFVDMMLDSALPRVELYEGDHIERCPEHPPQSIEAWHRSRGLWQDECPDDHMDDTRR